MRKYKPYMRVGTGLWALDRGAGMIEINLLDALVAELTQLFKDYELPAKSGLLQTVKVFPQYLPQPSEIEVIDDESGDESENTTTPQGYAPADIEANFPCIIVKLNELTIKEEGTLDKYRLNVNMLVGTYDESSDCQGYRDVLNIMERTRDYLLTMPNCVLAHSYQLQTPMKSYLFDDQPWPIFLGQIETLWETGRPLMPNNPNCEIRF